MNGEEGGRPRRTLGPRGPRRSGANKTDPWILTIIAALVVVAGGWFLGQGLAHMLGSKNDQPVPAATAAPLAAATSSPQPAAPSQPSPTASVRPLIKPAPKSTHKPAAKPVNAATPAAAPPSSRAPQPTARASAAPTPKAAPATAAPAKATAAPQKATAAPQKATAAPQKATAAPIRTMIPRAAVTAAPPVPEDIASSTVRAYIDALKRGDPQAASAYLGNGTPDEDFIDGATRITSLTSTRNSDGSYKVAVTLQTVKGRYGETFVVAPNGSGARILEKTAIKP
ncbi:MAG: hypothetical protein ABR508_05840 [Candidatus Baltobacteraceae bacterium]